MLFWCTEKSFLFFPYSLKNVELTFSSNTISWYRHKAEEQITSSLKKYPFSGKKKTFCCSCLVAAGYYFELGFWLAPNSNVCNMDCGLHYQNIDLIIVFACLVGWLNFSPVVNFINVKRANFTYESLFSSYVLALKKLSYEKSSRKTWNWHLEKFKKNKAWS